MARPPVLSDDVILRRARSVFVERGYAARTRQVSAAVGLTWGALAARFGSKRALFAQAMSWPARDADAPAQGQQSAANLPGLLEHLRCHLWERWPLRLQVRLAATGDTPDEAPDGLVHSLAAALEAHSRDGSIRSDMSAEALARIVLAMLTGDVAQRFVAGERALADDRDFIDSMVVLLTGS